MTHIIEIVKIALNIGIIFLDIVVSLKDIYEEVLAKFRSEFSPGAAEAAV